MVVIGLAIFLVLFFIKNGNETANKEIAAIKGNYENSKDIGKDSIKKEILCNIGENELCMTCEKKKMWKLQSRI